MACPVESVKRNLSQLLHESHEESWTPEFNSAIVAILNDDIIRDIFLCSCLQGPGHQSTTAPNVQDMPSAGIQASRRLLATCIMSDRPWLIMKFLQCDVNDAKFQAFNSEEDLKRGAGIDRVDARILLRTKYLFFGINFFKYLHSWSRRDRPQSEERNWIINELLELMRKIALPSNEREERIQADSKIDKLIIRKTDATAMDRVEIMPSKSRNEIISIQSLGYLVLDVLWFLHGGAKAVDDFDKLRMSGLKSILKHSATLMDLDPETSMAFEMAWIMIQPREKSCLRPAPDGSQDYHYIHTEFRKIWPSSVIHSFLSQDPNRSPDLISISTNQNSSQSSSHFEELEEARGFRWLYVDPAANLGITC